MYKHSIDPGYEPAIRVFAYFFSALLLIMLMGLIKYLRDLIKYPRTRNNPRV